MFTGIIETTARLEQVRHEGTNVHFTFSSALTSEFKIDQSVAHNGVCLTIVEIEGKRYRVTAIEETLNRTNLGLLSVGQQVNIERCLPANGRFDGHIVQGHVDTTATCSKIVEHNGSWELVFEYKKDHSHLTVEKGSITINGVSLTVVDSHPTQFSVHIIPYTFEHTNFKTIVQGSVVNLEFDIVGKYVARILGQK